MKRFYYSNLVGDKIPCKALNDWTLDLILIELETAVNNLLDYVEYRKRIYRLYRNYHDGVM